MDRVFHRDFANVPVVWEPREEFGKSMRDFMKMIGNKYKVQINDYWDLHKWSIENIPLFWEEIWNMSGIIYSKPYYKVVDLNIPMHEHIEWFEGARMNYAENLLRFRDEHVALILAGEDRQTERVTYAQMYEEAQLYAAALRKLGVQKNDRVSCFMSNRKEAVFAMLGATSIGAIWLGALPLMGAEAVLNRFQQVEPKVLFTVDRFSYSREEIEMLSKVEVISLGLSSLEKIVVVPSKPDSRLKDISNIKNSVFLEDFLEIGKKPDGTVPEIVFEQVSFTHPVFISYTSGTTGLPKVLVHGSGGILSNARDNCLQGNSERSGILLSMSSVGWVSWNAFVTGHFIGGTIMLFEGVPYFLSPTFLWDLVDEYQITNLFLTPSVLDDLEKNRFLPGEHNHLRSLKLIISGASVVKPNNYDFVYKKIKRNIIFTSAYVATEFMGASLLLELTLRMYKGEITVPTLGTDITVVDDSGKEILGQIGEVVFNKPVPYLPLGMWNDDDRSIYKITYFKNIPGKFAIGDLGMINPITKGFIICGRSDDTLKPKGWRFGSSEIYNIVDTFPEIENSLCVSQYNANIDERAVLFLKMRSSHLFTENLVKRIRDTISKELSPGHVPEVILETADIPHNMNGKKMEIVVKNIINKMPYNAETVINPECLKNFKNIPELLDF